MSTRERRRSQGNGRTAAIDEVRQTLVEPILSASDGERKAFAAILGVLSAAVATLYVASWIVGNVKGWW